MARTEKAQERKAYVTIRSPAGRKEKLETWRYWEIVGALQWMGTDRQLAYDTARDVSKMKPGESRTLSNGIFVTITRAKGDST